MSIVPFPVPVDLRNVDKKIYRVIDMVGCNRHHKEVGVPCYTVPRDSSSIPAYGICNHRAKGAGMQGRISEQAIQSERNGRMNYAKKPGNRLERHIRSKNFSKPRTTGFRKSA